MLSSRLIHGFLRFLDLITPNNRLPQNVPAHHRTGRRGEEDAYFYLRRRGYVMIARNFRSPRHHGEIDLIGWDKDVLCFIEVKTRTTRDVKPAQAAVDRKKRRDLRKVVREYLRTFAELPQWRFDVLTVQYESDSAHPNFELFQNAALSS
jgi:putative endonuclease